MKLKGKKPWSYQIRITWDSCIEQTYMEQTNTLHCRCHQ